MVRQDGLELLLHHDHVLLGLGGVVAAVPEDDEVDAEGDAAEDEDEGREEEEHDEGHVEQLQQVRDRQLGLALGDRARGDGGGDGDEGQEGELLFQEDDAPTAA